MQGKIADPVQFGARKMLAAWARNDYRTITEMTCSFRFAAHLQEKNAGNAERLDLLDQIGSALAETETNGWANSESNRERLCAYLRLLQDIGTSPC